MNVYMIMAAVIIFLALPMRGDLPRNKKYIIWACILMFVVYGLRDAYSVGDDSATSYLHQFQQLEKTTWAQLRNGVDLNDNLFWRLFAKLGYVVFNGNYQLFIATLSGFVTGVFGRFIYRYSNNPVQSFVYYWGLWFYTFNFSALKQSIAMSLLLLAFDAVIDRKLLKFLSVVILASLFHFPSIVFLPAYWLLKLNPRREFLAVLAAALLSVYLWRDQILNFMLQFYYEGREFIGEDRFFTGKVTVMLALVLIAFILRPPSKYNKVYAASMQFVAIATILQLFSVYNNVFERLADYYFQFSVIFVPFILDQRDIEPENRSVLITAAPYVLGVLCLLRFNDIVTRPTSYLMPYRFFFQAEPVEEALIHLTMIFRTGGFYVHI